MKPLRLFDAPALAMRDFVIAAGGTDRLSTALGVPEFEIWNRLPGGVHDERAGEFREQHEEVA